MQSNENKLNYTMRIICVIIDGEKNNLLFIIEFNLSFYLIEPFNYYEYVLFPSVGCSKLF